MAQTAILFFRDEGEAFAQFEVFRKIDRHSAVIIGPTRLLTGAGNRISSIDDNEDYSVVIGGTAAGFADPHISPPD